MESITSTIPGYRVYEYILVLSPQEELWNRIHKVKEQFAAAYQLEPVHRGRPRITLVRFVQYALLEERIVNGLRRLAMGFPPFKVELKDYGSFPSHTIFIPVVSKLPVQALVKTVRTSSQRLMKLNDDHKPHFILEPQVVIARKLKPWQYEKGWLEYSQKHFTGRFIASSMTLLKRPFAEEAEQRARYQPVGSFEFQNLPVATRQGELF